jgi:hypothetical protein
MDTKDHKKGPSIYENWRALIDNEESLGAFEVPLFTDADIIGMPTEGYGPYKFLNMLAFNEGHIARPAIVLRVEKPNVRLFLSRNQTIKV